MVHFMLCVFDHNKKKSKYPASIRTGHGTTDWFQIGKGVRQGCISSPCVFNLYAEYIMQNVGLDEAQAGIRIAGRNINNLRHADDTTLMAKNEDELNSLLMKVKEESEKAGLKLNIHQMVNTEIRLIIFFAAKDGVALYTQQKQHPELTMAQIMNSLLPNSEVIEESRENH